MVCKTTWAVLLPAGYPILFNLMEWISPTPQWPRTVLSSSSSACAGENVTQFFRSDMFLWWSGLVLEGFVKLLGLSTLGLSECCQRCIVSKQPPCSLARLLTLAVVVRTLVESKRTLVSSLKREGRNQNVPHGTSDGDQLNFKRDGIRNRKDPEISFSSLPFYCLHLSPNIFIPLFTPLSISLLLTSEPSAFLVSG